MRTGAGSPLLCAALLAGGLLLGLTACENLGPDTPRRAWQRTAQAEAARDYAALWEMLSRYSRADIERTLQRIKADPGFQLSMSERFKVDPQALQAMSARDFYITMLEQAEQLAPAMIAAQADAARQAEFLREEINRDRAVVYWRNGRGEESYTLFILEDDRWRTVLNR